jgi:hypothetical protein
MGDLPATVKDTEVKVIVITNCPPITWLSNPVPLKPIDIEMALDEFHLEKIG